MCPFTNYNLYGSVAHPPAAVVQLESHFSEIPLAKPDLLALYNDGSFFSDREVSSADRLEVARWVRDRGFRRLVVESLPQFLTIERLRVFLASLAPTKLTVGVGLQSATDLVREICVNTSFSRSVFERAVDTTLGLGAEIKVYVMLKPPFLLESEAIADVATTASYLNGLGVSNLTLCPTRVAENTLVARLYQEGLFHPPDLWTVAAAVAVCSRHIKCRVAMQNLTGGDFDAVMSSAPTVAARVRLMRALQTHADECAPFVQLDAEDSAEVASRIVAARPIKSDDLLLRIDRYLNAIERPIMIAVRQGL
jgi:hypothetical protein